MIANINKEKDVLKRAAKHHPGSKKGMNVKGSSRILLLQDSDEVRDFALKFIRRALGCCDILEISKIGPALLTMIKENFDLIVIDLEAQGLVGGSFLREARSVIRIQEKPILALTENITPQLLREFKEDRETWFIEKSVPVKEASELVRVLLNLQKA